MRITFITLEFVTDRPDAGSKQPQMIWHENVTAGHASVEGMCHGNDTGGRIVGDRNRILACGIVDGRMAGTRRPTLLTITDTNASTCFGRDRRSVVSHAPRPGEGGVRCTPFHRCDSKPYSRCEQPAL